VKVKVSKAVDAAVARRNADRLFELRF